MPLVTLKTDLKSLKYGLDRPGGGSSNQPYIQRQIPLGDTNEVTQYVNKNGSLKEETQKLTLSPDFKIRGGTLAYNLADNGVSSLTQLLIGDEKNFNSFAAKTNILSRMSVATEMSSFIAPNQGSYAISNTLEQAQYGFQGFHFNTLNQPPSITLNPFTFSTTYDEHLKVQKSEDEWNKLNRLVLLQDAIVNSKKIRLPGNIGYNLNPNGNTSQGVSGIINKAISYVAGDAVLSYLGGPGATNGAGVTRIKFADKRTGLDKNLSILDSGVVYRGLFPHTLGYKQLLNQFQNLNGNVNNQLQDFRKEVIDATSTSASSILAIAPNYNTQNRDVRFAQGSPGRNSKDIFKYDISAYSNRALDQITAYTPYESPTVDPAVPEDIIKFRIAVINNDKTDGSAVYLHFRAFIDSFSDGFNSTWSDTSYVGRGENLYSYGGGFTRDVSLGFTIVAQSKAELIPMYNKLNYLISTLAPDYTTTGAMRGSLIRLTVGDYLVEQPGILKSLSLDPFSGTWETAINTSGGKDNTVGELPHIIKVTGFGFTPIHDFAPRKSANPRNSSDTPYIALGDNNRLYDTLSNY